MKQDPFLSVEFQLRMDKTLLKYKKTHKSSKLQKRDKTILNKIDLAFPKKCKHFPDLND